MHRRPACHGCGRLEVNSVLSPSKEDSIMRFNGSASPDQLSVLHQIFKERCCAAGIEAGHPDHEALALRIMKLFESGIQSIEEIIAALDARQSR